MARRGAGLESRMEARASEVFRNAVSFLTVSFPGPTLILLLSGGQYGHAKR